MKTTLPNVQILDLAHSYYSAAEVLADAGANAIPIINLRCHAIELFLKALPSKRYIYGHRHRCICHATGIGSQCEP